MNIGLVKEIKTHEHRVMLTPDGVGRLVKNGNLLIVESGAGVKSGFDDEVYEGVGARILPSSEKVFEQAELIVKVQPPMPIEYELIRPDHMVFSFMFPHRSSEKINALKNRKAIFFDVEHIQAMHEAMAEITGKVAINQAMKYLEMDFGGKGILFSGACGVPGARVTILGCGISGITATLQSLHLGATVNLVDEDYEKLRLFEEANPHPNLTTIEYDRGILNTLLLETDVLIATEKPAGQKTNLVVKKEDLRLLEKGSLILDLSINQGDCIEISRSTTPDTPIYHHEDILYYAVSDIPSAVVRTTSQVLSDISFPLINQLAKVGFQEAVSTNPVIRQSLVLYKGKIVNPVLGDENDPSSYYNILELLEMDI